MDISIIIPAYNEENTIERCLKSIFKGTEEANIEIIIVCNGCTDNTADVARKYEPKVLVLETKIGSKSNALNLGDRKAKYFPRFYIDADVQVSGKAIIKVAEVLETNKALAAAPMMNIILNKTSYFVKKYYKVWENLPYAKEGMIGSGIYGISREGRTRFNDFPDIIADDAFIRLQFKETERITVSDVKFNIFPPRNLKNLIAIKTRVKVGGNELRKKYPELKKNEGKRNVSCLLEKILKLEDIWDIIVYGIISILIIVKYKMRLIFGNNKKWDRDLTSRGE